MAVRLGAICAVLLALLPASPPPARADALAAVFERVALSVVVVRTSERDIANEGTQRTVIISWFGSGVLIAPDWKVLTAAHLVPAASEMAAFQTLLGLASEVHGPTTYEMLYASESTRVHTGI